MIVLFILMALVILIFVRSMWLMWLDDRQSDYIDRRIEEINAKTPEGVDPDYTELWEEIMGGKK